MADTKESTPIDNNKKEGSTNSEKKKEQRQAFPKEKGRGIVKQVLSGDTIVVIHLEKNQTGPPTEREIVLSNINAPKLGRRKPSGQLSKKKDEQQKDSDYQDKPFAWESKEFLRKLLITKPVTYIIEYKNPQNNKEYGSVFLKDDQSVAKIVVQHGFATVRRPNTPGGIRQDVKDLIDAEDGARNAGLGIHTKDDKVKAAAVRPIHEFEPTQLFDQLKGKPLEGIIEQVLSGHVLRISILPQFYNIQLLLSGVECPEISAKGEHKPFAREAKFFTDHFILNRDVIVILEGVDKMNFYGSVSTKEQGNFSEKLLEIGLAKYVDWSGQRTPFADKLKQAEKTAKAKKLRIWANYVEPKLSRQEEKKLAKPGKEITGKVVKIIHGGAIKVQLADQTEYVDVFFSSIQIPRQGNIVQMDDEPRHEAIERTHAWEAKEYGRKRLISQRVRCVLDYVRPEKQRPDQGPLPERPFYSVYIDKNNVAVELVEQGLARAQPHKGGEPRSRDYEFILFAEQRAKKAEKGVWAPDEKVGIVKITDLTIKANPNKPADQKSNSSEDQKKTARVNLKAKILASLKRGGRQRAVVEHVYSALKLKLYIPKESCIINFAFSAVKQPRSDSTNLKPHEKEALDAAVSFVNDRCLHHDVEFDVVDQGGGNNFIGNLWVNKENLAVLLLQEGLAELNKPALRFSQFATEFIIAEDSAKKGRKHLWKDWDPKVEEEARKKRQEAEEERRKQKQQLIEVNVTEIVDASRFYVQVLGAGVDQLNDVMQKLQLTDDNMPYAPSVGELVKGQFTADDNWYRARVLNKASDAEFKVLYVDYGNVEVLPTSRLRKLDPALGEKTLQAQATEARLAFITVPQLEEDYGEEAAEFLRELVWGKSIVASVEGQDGNVLSLTLGDRESKVHINAALVREGLAKVDKVRGKQYTQLIEKLKEEEQVARSNHSYIWEYGDPGSDEDEEPSGKKPAPTKTPGPSKTSTAKK